MNVSGPTIRVFTTCPQSKDGASESYAARVAEVARWSEEAEFHGILVYTDNSLVDPWLVAQLILQSTRSLSPLVAVQPVYMHPYAAAKMIASLAFLHGRRLDVNLVAGAFARICWHSPTRRRTTTGTSDSWSTPKSSADC